jgi:hypothetical protein
MLFLTKDWRCDNSLTGQQPERRLGEEELNDRWVRLCRLSEELAPHTIIGIGLTIGVWANVDDRYSRHGHDDRSI